MHKLSQFKANLNYGRYRFGSTLCRICNEILLKKFVSIKCNVEFIMRLNCNEITLAQQVASVSHRVQRLCLHADIGESHR